MINEKQDRNQRRKRRAYRVRKQVRGTAKKPRLTIFKSNQHLFAQLIDDEQGVTLASFGTMSKELRAKGLGHKGKEAAKQIGIKIAEAALEKKIERAVFDRGHYKYHGLLVELANAARETGLQF